jgi:hypothetical protein
MWCVAELDEECVEKMEDVLEVHEKPLSAEEPVVCVDEKSVTLHKDVREPLPMKPGSVAKRDYEYERCGTANVFCAVEPKAGVHFTRATPTRSAAEFADFVRAIADHYLDAETIHLVMDNLNTHCRKTLVDRLGEKQGGSALGSVHCSLHAQTRQLAEPSGDRNQFVLPAMPGETTDRRSSLTTARDACLAPSNESETRQD